MASQKGRSAASPSNPSGDWTELRGGFARSAYRMYGLTPKTHPTPCISALLLSHRLLFCETINDERP